MAKMLSRSILKTFSRFILWNTKLYLIPSIWDSNKRRFVQVTNMHKKIECHFAFLHSFAILEILFRIWCNFAYGFMVYVSLKDPSTIIRALMPLMYLCALNWCAIIRFVSHAFRTEIEQFINNFFQMNSYLGEWILELEISIYNFICTFPQRGGLELRTKGCLDKWYWNWSSWALTWRASFAQLHPASSGLKIISM